MKVIWWLVAIVNCIAFVGNTATWAHDMRLWLNLAIGAVNYVCTHYAIRKATA
jgi:hypothetical protein